MSTFDNDNFIKTSNNANAKALYNIVEYFRIDLGLNGLLRYNEFTGCVEYAKKAPWHGLLEGKILDDRDVVHIKYYLSALKKFEIGKEAIRDAIIEISQNHAYHPVRDYLKPLIWDNVPRIDEWLITGCGVEGNQYVREVGRKWLCAAVARIYRPGIKFDHILILEGEEDIGKSTALRVLGDPWFTDTIDLMLSDKDIIEKMLGKWIIEIPELKGLGQRDAEHIIAFLSCQTDKQRLAYRRDAIEYPRQNVFAGTSNKDMYLIEDKGSRRFWPVLCSKINLKWLRENRDQLWAEAIVKFNDGEKLFLEDEVFKFAKEQQVKRLTSDDIWEEVARKHVQFTNETTIQEILINALGFAQREIRRSHEIQIGRTLRKLGFTRQEKRAFDGSRFSYVRMDKLVEADLERINNANLKQKEVTW